MVSVYVVVLVGFTSTHRDRRAALAVLISCMTLSVLAMAYMVYIG